MIMGNVTMTKEDFKTTFLNFLDEKGLKKKYFDNLREQKDIYPNELGEYFDNLGILEWVNVFQYAKTPEGVDYWYNVQKEWEEKFYEIIDELESEHIDYDEDVRDSIW